MTTEGVGRWEPNARGRLEQAALQELVVHSLSLVSENAVFREDVAQVRARLQVCA